MTSMPLVHTEEVTGSIPVSPTRPVITIGAEAMDKIFANEH
jgi:hypothetical protein